MRQNRELDVGRPHFSPTAAPNHQVTPASLEGKISSWVSIYLMAVCSDLLQSPLSKPDWSQQGKLHFPFYLWLQHPGDVHRATAPRILRCSLLFCVRSLKKTITELSQFSPVTDKFSSKISFCISLRLKTIG